MILVCDIKPFDFNQTVYLVNDENNNAIIDNLGEMKLTSLYSFVPSYCYSNGIEKIKLYGNARYNEGVKEQIEAIEETQFSNNKRLIVEVI